MTTYSDRAAVDQFINPDINAAPIDLTKMGAAVDVPLDHPLRRMNGATPSELAPFNNSRMTSEQIAAVLDGFDARLKKVEQNG